MKRRKLVIFGGLALALVLVVGLAAFWYLAIRSDSPEEVSLDAAATAAATSGAGGSTSPADLAGTWNINNSASFAGYRVEENLVGFGTRTAVGRTSDIQGSLVYDGRAITNVLSVTNLTTLKSDQSLRDDTLKMQALQSCQFPTATFALTTPIALDASAVSSGPISRTIQGNLTLHGVTRPVSLDVKGQIQGGAVVIVGSTRINFADYSIPQPRSVYVVSMDDQGIMEFQLIFTKASASTAAPQPPATPTPASCGGPSGPGGPGGPGGQPPGMPPSGPPGGAPPGINTPAPVPTPFG